MPRPGEACGRKSSDAALIEQYVASPAFHTSFLPNDKDESGLHGPFVAERVTAADFVPLREVELGSYLESVELSDTPGEDTAQPAKVSPHLRAAFEGGRRCYVLRPTSGTASCFMSGAPCCSSSASSFSSVRSETLWSDS